MPLFRSRPLPPREDKNATSQAKGMIEEDWLDESKPRQGSRKSQRKTIVKRNDEEEGNAQIEQVGQPSCSYMKKKKDETTGDEEASPSSVVTLSPESDVLSIPSSIVPVDVEMDEDTIPLPDIIDPEIVITSPDSSVTTHDISEDSHDTSPFDHSIRIRYKGEIKRITLDKNVSLNKQINIIYSAFNISTDDQQIFMLVYENTDSRINMDAEPIVLPEGLNIVVDVFRLVPLSKDLLESERVALAEFDVSASEGTSNSEKQPIDEYSLEDGRFRIKVRLTIQVPHGSCLVCKSNCATCSKSTEYLDTSKMSKRKETIFKTKIASTNCEMSDLFSLVNQHIRENYIIGNEKNANLEWLKAKYEFDAEEVTADSTPNDLDMDDESLVDARLKDSRCEIKQCNCSGTASNVNTKAKKGKGKKNQQVGQQQAQGQPTNRQVNGSHARATRQQQIMTVVDLD